MISIILFLYAKMVFSTHMQNVSFETISKFCFIILEVEKAESSMCSVYVIYFQTSKNSRKFQYRAEKNEVKIG